MGGGGGPSATVVESKEWYLSAYAAENIPTPDHLKLRTATISLEYNSIPDQHVAIQSLFISVDPYLRSTMTGRDGELCLPPLPLNKVITAFGVGRVVQSRNNNFSRGDIVVNLMSPVAEYCVVPSDLLRKIDPTVDISLPEYLSCLGVEVNGIEIGWVIGNGIGFRIWDEWNDITRDY